ncbi:MAG: hypothetical protein M1830_003362 [Pleopsidium flavum]|nr:MAG: hypothetical protein M1830_003362 [Pleopsidium flavum]
MHLSPKTSPPTNNNMVINATYLAQRTRSSVNWADAKRRVVRAYREWLRAAPEIQQMYSLNMPVSALRTKLRQEFERHRYVSQLGVVDMLLFQSNAEYQVQWIPTRANVYERGERDGRVGSRVRWDM